MKTGQKGTVADIEGGHAFVHRLSSMGIHRGREVTKVSQFVLRGPVAIKVGRGIVALGYGMAHKVIVEIE